MAMTQLISKGKQFFQALGMLVCVLILSACGGGSGGDSAPAPEPKPPIINTAGQGQFKDASLLKTISTAEMVAAIDLAGNSALQFSPRYAVKAYRLTYLTIDGQGQVILASALATVPQKPAGSSSPVLSYQHATLKHEADAPSYLADPASPELVMASLGYIVLSADYVGYGASKGASHPYLLSAPSASAVMDMLTAARYWRQSERVLDNGQLFLTGYSEGGYVTIATQRALQAGNSVHRNQVVRVIAGSGPYNVGLTMDELLKLVRQENPLLGGLLSPGLLKNLSDADRNNVRDALLRQLLGSDADVVFMPTFLDNYFADNRLAIEAENNVDVWRPEVPVYFFHGRDDRTVPYPNAASTLQTMQTLGAGKLVSLTDCQAQPAGHSECVRPFWQFMVTTFASVAQNL